MSRIGRVVREAHTVYVSSDPLISEDEFGQWEDGSYDGPVYQDLFKFIPQEIADRFQYCHDLHEILQWESVVTMWLVVEGKEHGHFLTGERDSFGPLTRTIQICGVNYIYG